MALLIKTKCVEIELDRKRNLTYPAPAMAKMFSALEVSPNDQESVAELKLVDTLALPEKLAKVARMLWAGLVTEDPGITVEDCESLIFFDNMDEIGAKCAEAMMLSKGSAATEVPVPLATAPAAE
jgi:hypothetical protein